MRTEPTLRIPLGILALLAGLAIYAGDAFDRLVDGEWWPVAGIEEAGLPTLFAKAARLVLAEA